ncbi:unnamed protein product [Arabidopsis thaliana]|uniref:Uncharacterized protein n=1 Tax=Arabidopsis thaliana TaxID=3702 RepID=A0A5S9XFK4_ARATH|nr:unnamed protein product [Arabidopsis thaliana]VYS58594.1 unnamed protein product [Arabidopsis thaliana]
MASFGLPLSCSGFMKPTLSGRRIVTKFTSKKVDESVVETELVKKEVAESVAETELVKKEVAESVAETELVKKKIDESVAEAYAAVDGVNVDEEVGPAGLKTVFVDVGKKFVDIKKKLNTR